MSRSFTCSVHRVQGAIASIVEGLHRQQENCCQEQAGGQECGGRVRERERGLEKEDVRESRGE